MHKIEKNRSYILLNETITPSSGESNNRISKSYKKSVKREIQTINTMANEST